MRHAIVAGNWKMFGSKDSVAELLEGIKQGVTELSGVELLVFPPFVYLSQVQQAMQGTSVNWGGQNVSANEPGAFTGEIAVQMLQDFGCRYVIVGHSERRQLFQEDDVLVAMKFAHVKHAGLTPIFCVGETLEQRQQGESQAVVSAQIDAILSLEGGVELFRDAVIAYEPVWAIGTGMTASSEEAQEIHKMIREKLALMDENIAQETPILYGGSVKAVNAKALFAMPDIDGGLVGGASLDPQEFLEIAQCIS